MQEIHGQYWKIRMYGLGCNAKLFDTDLTVKKEILL